MKHLKESNETYLSHLLFAGKVGLTLVFRGLVFILHAILPVCKVPAIWNLSNTSEKLYHWDEYALKRKRKN